MEIHIPTGARKIIARLEQHGYEAYIVGGCVRDSLMGKRPSDWDICTSARPDEMKALFCSQRLILTGEKHGTVAVILHGKPYEMTTYRLDGSYRDHRHPDNVQFVDDLAADLARRDFTIWPRVSCGASARPRTALPRMRCAFCGCTALPQGSALRWMQPQPGRRGSWHRTWTASLQSAFRRNWQSCWLTSCMCLP